jgi:hypothetical protein
LDVVLCIFFFNMAHSSVRGCLSNTLYKTYSDRHNPMVPTSIHRVAFGALTLILFRHTSCPTKSLTLHYQKAMFDVQSNTSNLIDVAISFYTRLIFLTGWSYFYVQNSGFLNLLGFFVDVIAGLR